MGFVRNSDVKIGVSRAEIEMEEDDEDVKEGWDKFDIGDL